MIFTSKSVTVSVYVSWDECDPILGPSAQVYITVGQSNLNFGYFFNCPNGAHLLIPSDFFRRSGLLRI